MDDIEIRQATPQDKEAVLGIRDDVYGGRDYLAAFYDNFMSSPNTTSFVVVYNGNIEAYQAVTIVDDGRTMVSRAGRVSKKYVGTGLSRRMTANSENWSVARGITRKTTVVSENNFADLTKPSLQNVYRLVLTKDVLQYPLDTKQFQLILVNGQSLETPLEASDSVLADHIRSKTLREYLFPKERIVINVVPHRVMESNIPLFREQGGMTMVFSDVGIQAAKPQGVLSFGSMYPIQKPPYAYNIEIYGSCYSSIRAHVIKHLRRLKDTMPHMTSVFVFVDEGFPANVVDEIFLEFGIKRTLLRGLTKRHVFERSLQPASRY